MPRELVRGYPCVKCGDIDHETFECQHGKRFNQDIQAMPLCETKPMCWKRSRYLHGDGSAFGKFLCGEHHGKRRPCGEHCSRLLIADPRRGSRMAVCECLGRPIIQCNACLGLFCLECWIDHWHMTMLTDN